MIVGVFARADHPEGWGYPAGRAHGYVTIFVRCESREVLGLVVDRFAIGPFYGRADVTSYFDGNLGEWFGGRFDHVATVPDVEVPYGPFQCRGDNRMVAVYDAADIVASGDEQS